MVAVRNSVSQEKYYKFDKLVKIKYVKVDLNATEEEEIEESPLDENGYLEVQLINAQMQKSSKVTFGVSVGVASVGGVTMVTLSVTISCNCTGWGSCRCKCKKNKRRGSRRVPL